MKKGQENRTICFWVIAYFCKIYTNSGIEYL